MFPAIHTPSRVFAYRWLDEALATAVGNAWAYRKLTGRDASGRLYADPVIDAYARALIPLVSTYLDTRRTVDDAFLDTALARFRTTFPTAIRDPLVVMPFLSILTDARPEQLDSLLAPLYGAYRIRGISQTFGLSETAIQDLLHAPALSVLVLTDVRRSTAVLRAARIPDALWHGPSVMHYALVNGQPLLILTVRTVRDVTTTVTRIREHGLARRQVQRSPETR